MKIEKIERLYFNDTEWEKWVTFWRLMEEIGKASEDGSELSKMVSDIQETMNEIEEEFLEEE